MDVKNIFKKLKELSNIENDVALAEKLDANYNTFQTWQKRNSIPYEKIIDYSARNNLDLNEVFLGDIYLGAAGKDSFLKNKEKTIFGNEKAELIQLRTLFKSIEKLMNKER